MHYEQFKLTSHDVVAPIVRAFPFALVAVNGPSSPMVAYAPLTFRPLADGQQSVDFHLARSNAIVPLLLDGTQLTLTLNGPSAHVSPGWYTARFPEPGVDRSTSAPTLNYLSLVLTGRLQILGMNGLTSQVRDLVHGHEGDAGWRYEELAPSIRESWMKAIIGCRVTIDDFDCTAKLSQNYAADKPGILAGLRARGAHCDLAMADLMQAFDGTAASLVRALALDAAQ